MTFLPTNPDQLVLALALLSLHAQGWVEPLEPSWQPFPILAQQLLATLLQTGGVARSELVARLANNAAFSRISASSIEDLIDKLLDDEILGLADGTLTFGHAGERQFGFRSFSRLASVFNTPEAVTVSCGSSDVGTLDRWFVDEMQDRDRSTFLLGGRAWKILSWPDDGSAMEVAPADHAEAPLFTGGGVVLSFEVMQAVRRVLAADQSTAINLPDGFCFDAAATAALPRARELVRPQRLDAEGTALVRDNGALRWYTYGGLRANRAIADVLNAKASRSVTSTNTALRIADDAFDQEAFAEELRSLAEPSRFASALDERPAPKVGAEVKFVDLLPQNQYERFARERVYDVTGATTVLKEPVRFVAI